MSPTPIIILGKNPIIATKVREDLLPEYDVIHVILTLPQALADLPLLLSSPPQAPPDSTSNHGSQTYTARPKAVVFGGGFDDAAVAEMRSACKDADGGIVWLRGNYPSKIEEMPPLSDREAYGAATARLVKKKLEELNVRGDGEVKDGDWFYN